MSGSDSEVTGGALGPAAGGALGELSRLAELSVEEHVAVFDAIHESLRDALAGAEIGPGGQPR